ncbi:response regulator transcription factor [Ramlibacter sp. 2FC]|uniref:LuxR C-terminal-related transcriptional regulator n=1 Tax=Ramlibacter sp. 2FC TaxID=2502188 RepID=UPI0010F496C4|nr:response regulator transcription factor [Ramlibacter sp. 2FC]
MNTWHYFLLASRAGVPARWREAFPGGQTLAEAGLMDRLGSTARDGRLVWLSTADVRWHAHLRQILQAWPAERVVLLSSEPNDREGLRAMEEGASGYAHAYAVPELLQEVALVVAHGGLWVGPSLIQRLLGATRVALARRADPPDEEVAASEAAPALEGLSAREAEVARAVVAGRSNKEVAALLHISERTVKAHLGAVFDKLGVRDRLQLALRLAATAGATDRAA